MPDGVNAYLIPYGRECTLQFSYKGLCDMAIREGIALKFASDIVRKNDIFKWSNGELVEHTITAWDEEERGEVVGVWVRAYLPDNEGKFNPDLHVDERMSEKDIQKVRSKSQNINGVWKEWFDEMAKKSCLKRMFKKMRNTPNLAEAIAEDNKEFKLDGQFDRSQRVSASDILSGKRKETPDAEAPIDVPYEEVKDGDASVD
jgi:recombination protein RecT